MKQFINKYLIISGSNCLLWSGLSFAKCKWHCKRFSVLPYSFVYFSIFISVLSIALFWSIFIISYIKRAIFVIAFSITMYFSVLKLSDILKFRCSIFSTSLKCIILKISFILLSWYKVNFSMSIFFIKSKIAYISVVVFNW